MRWGYSLVALCACGRLGFDERTDGGTGGDMPLGPFGAPQSIPALTAAYDIDDPGISPDGLELYVASYAGATEDIYVSRRTSRSAPWPMPVVVPGMDTAVNEKGPELSDGGLTMYFESDGNIMVATRGALDQPWSIEPTGLGVDYGSPVVCDGGRMMYLRRGNGTTADLYVSTRTAVPGPWSTPSPVTELNSQVFDSGPWAPPDCSRMYFDSNRGGGVVPYMAERNAVTGMFEAPVELADLDTTIGSIHDLSMTPDERYLVFAHRNGDVQQIWEASR